MREGPYPDSPGQAIDSKELDTNIEAYSQSGAMQASFGWFRAFGAVSAFNQSYTTKKLTVLVLALGRQVDGWVSGSDEAKCGRECSRRSHFCSGRWVIEEQPAKLLRELLSFLR